MIFSPKVMLVYFVSISNCQGVVRHISDNKKIVVYKLFISYTVYKFYLMSNIDFPCNLLCKTLIKEIIMFLQSHKKRKYCNKAFHFLSLFED